MIQVVLIIPTLDQSGAEKQFALLASRLPREEFAVRVVALSRGGPMQEMLTERGIPVEVLGKRSRLDLQTLRRLRELITYWEPQVVLSCLFAGNAYARLATLGFGKDRPATVVSERCVDAWKSGWQFWLDRRLRARTDRLVANSASVSTFYREQGFPAERITVIPNGVEVPPRPATSREEFCRQLELPPDAKLIAFVGRLAGQKRLKDLIWGAQLLRQAEGRAFLLLIGGGPDRDELELYARDVEAASHVRFLGHRSDAAALLHLIDVFWLASEYEGMSNSLMEAMACGRPVVVSDIPPNRELVEHGREGWIVNLGDSVGFSQFTRKLIDDPDLANRMGAAGAQRMRERFSVEAMVSAYAGMLRDLAQKNDQQPPAGPVA